MRRSLRRSCTSACRGPEVFAVAWGERAVELLNSGAAYAGSKIERLGSLAVTGAAGATEGSFTCWISGRLTNAEELRERFGMAPAEEPSALVARLHAQLGFDTCELLRGTFVVVAIDRDREVATIVRDQLGGRPLVYARVGGGALFAEHERAIIDLLPSTPGPDRLALALWIERGILPSGRTLFDGIRPIPPAHRVLLSAEGIAVEPYWRLSYQGVVAGSRQGAAERLREAAFAAIQRAAQGARRPAVSLSGGLDSACVAAGLADRAQPRAAALALAGVFPEHPETDERELIEATARHTDLSVELIRFDESASILEPALEHIDRWSLPPVTPNLFVWRPLMARARELGVDAMLDGEGGDELFAYSPYLIADMLRTGRVLAAWRLTRRIPEIGAHAGVRTRLRAMRVFGVRRLVPSTLKRRRWTPADSPGSLLMLADASALEELEDAGSARGFDGPVWWRALAEDLTQAGDALGVSGHLRRWSIDDRIDQRHPFLFDLDLLRAVLANPPEMQFDPIRDRALLRDALRGHIPEAVRTRHAKSYFTDLLAAGLAADGAMLADGPSRIDAPVRAFVRAEPLEQLLHESSAPRDARAARRLWHVGLADVWLRSIERPDYLHELVARRV
jgi:asparagine synthase (glutamine-hydrolysing)